MLYPQLPPPSYFRAKIASKPLRNRFGAEKRPPVGVGAPAASAARTIPDTTRTAVWAFAQTTIQSTLQPPTAPHPARIFRRSMRKWSYVSHQ